MKQSYLFMPYMVVIRRLDHTLLAKVCLYKGLKREESFRRVAKIFNNPTSSIEDVISARERLLLIVYGAKGDTALDKLRPIKFCGKNCIKYESCISRELASNISSFRSILYVFTTKCKFGEVKMTLIQSFGDGL